ncbi:AMP nucleosidase [Rhizosaccharibacter radicis]|uniref:AMP nucleosidase n=1 Tax=Rhizosaccharibacter radicis TaxID=2782605 RepID=A0ABT1VY47_9PROT|nr:AMP nucleosidase [Acetobacteraceae bacterium KSS12]
MATAQGGTSAFGAIRDSIGTGFEAFTDAGEAVDRLDDLFQESLDALRSSFEAGDPGTAAHRSEATYPYLAMELLTDAEDLPEGTRFPYGVQLEPGFYGTTVTRPALFRSYLREQIAALLSLYGRPVLVGRSRRPIPLPYVIENSVTDITEAELRRLSRRFALPDLTVTDDRIANCELQPNPSLPRPLALFTAERTDYSLARLRHYTGTDPAHFQRFVLLTNYQRYVDAFRQWGREQVDARADYELFAEPGGILHRPGDGEATPPANLPQMPAYHLTRADGNGITLINIGVGPSNAKTITDHVAVLRPHCWLMLGHCAGLRRTQRLGDYVLAHGYLRDDHVLDDDLPPDMPVPPIAEVQVALQEATSRITGLQGDELKTRMRTGTVMTTDNRNWELRFNALFARINMSRSIAVDMESATIAANGFRFRVPYGTLLCVSDKPLHGELKLGGMAQSFYRERVSQHLLVGLETMRALREAGVHRLHSRKLRGFDEPPFR